MDTRRPALTAAAAALVPVAFLTLFFVFPLVTILERGLTSEGAPSLPDGTPALVWFTTWQAALSTALTLVAGLPLAWVIGRFRFRGRSLTRALVLVPFVLPTVVVATAFLELLPDAVERGLPAILAAHVFFNVAVVVRIVGGAWARLDPRSAEAAAVLGAGPLRRAREVTVPQLAPALAASSALTFLFCFTSFGVILILGGPGRATVETEIYNQAARLFDLRAAAHPLAPAARRRRPRADRCEHPGSSRRRPRRSRRRGDVLRRPVARERLASSSCSARQRSCSCSRSPSSCGARSGAGARSSEETPPLLVEPWQAAVYSVAFATVAALIALARRRPRRRHPREAADRPRRRRSSCCRSEPPR